MLHVHINSRKAYKRGALIAFTWLCHHNDFNYKRDEDINTEESTAENGFGIIICAE